MPPAYSAIRVQGHHAYELARKNENVEMPAGGLPAKILNIEDLDLPEKREEYVLIQFYGLKFTTDKGDLILDYRNESNGYYGGNLTWPGDYYYGGVYKQNISNEEFGKI